MSLKGNIPVIPTPFLNGAIEYAGFDRLMERTIDRLDGYVVCGSTGEAPSLLLQERIDIVRYLSERMPDGKELVVGLGHTNLREAVAIGVAAKESGVRSALVPSPYYFPNSLQMVTDYMGELAEQTGLDLVFYDNPVTTKTHYTADQLLQMVRDVPQIKAVKMTDHHFEKIRSLKKNSSLAVFGGDDIICFRAFEAGIDGNMIIAPIVYPEAFRECWDTYQSGNREESFRIFSQVILPFIHLFGPGDEIATTKALLHQLGVFSSFETKLPLLPVTEERLREIMLGYHTGASAYAV
ncbi:dihydrodipicolinate synthase family protein [Paenibacillus aurantius]|uniref:Dihydrodipicolinate synthase family protein n=1 Tax=Paenibacillus aurantius TaxID=2918900 RepID=A0AA96LEN9_9BACL|nr:dihydrodipicolinate synthase family protein [Paenibacillus aurantius]WNQ12351.1 dihydrodipicolinate synthase family protein [Paenibacillus aurantius]